MKNYIKLIIITFLLTFPVQSFAGHEIMNETDAASAAQISFIDLRDRETYVQITNTDSVNRTLHVQIFNVDQACNENNFFDVFTPNDTHIYNMRDIQTNDGNPSGVILPENTFGFIIISALDDDGDLDESLRVLIGSFRILDNAGYEYRANSAGWNDNNEPDEDFNFNFSANNGVSLSDVIIVTADPNESNGEWESSPLDEWYGVDVDIFDANENPLSCRDVIFACIKDENSPNYQALLEEQDSDLSASVAAFEYGINEAIPHSRGGELLCPGNVITEGWVFLEEEDSSSDNDNTAYFIGLNNGNGRGTIDSIWRPNDEL